MYACKSKISHTYIIYATFSIVVAIIIFSAFTVMRKINIWKVRVEKKKCRVNVVKSLCRKTHIVSRT